MFIVLLESTSVKSPGSNFGEKCLEVRVKSGYDNYLHIFSHEKQQSYSENVPIVKVVKAFFKFLVSERHVTLVASFVKGTDI